jgi:hypothetical protein
VTDDGLRRTLEDNFGPIKDLDIIRNKACAFLEFKSVESARRAIQFCSPHSVGGQGGIECDGMFIHIEVRALVQAEERMPKPDRRKRSPRAMRRDQRAASGAVEEGTPAATVRAAAGAAARARREGYRRRGSAVRASVPRGRRSEGRREGSENRTRGRTDVSFHSVLRCAVSLHVHSRHPLRSPTESRSSP